jgi:mRNA-degrading endonuclease RelE of RelBE toxin-antitoxin system
MTVNITTHPEFDRQMKRYAKKYRSLASDFADFLKSIRENPFQGTDLGGGIRKVRLAVASKGIQVEPSLRMARHGFTSKH